MVRDKISKTDFSGDESIVEAVGMTEAYQFPIIGGGVLLSLYALSKAFGPTVLNYVLLLYFVFVGMESFKGILNNYTFIGKIKQDEKVKNLKSPILFHNVHLLGVNFSLSGFDILWTRPGNLPRASEHCRRGMKIFCLCVYPEHCNHP